MSAADPPPERDVQEISTPEAFASVIGATEAQLADLQRYREFIHAGSARMNLVGPSALAEFWSRHALDSAQLFHVEPLARVWADIGSGAGFPGIVIAVLLKGCPDARVHLVESVGKRAEFLRDVCQALDLPADVHHERAEQMKPLDPLHIVSARACAPLPRLFDFTVHLMRRGAVGLFLKGRTVESELAEARKAWSFTASLIPSLSDAEGRILRIEGVTRRGT